MPELNWLAVGAAAVAALVVSTVYYMVFASRMSRLSPAYADADARPEPWKIGLELLRSAVVGTVVASLASLLDVMDLAGAAQLGLALWVGFPVALLTGSVVWERVPAELAAIHAGDWLLKLLLVSAIVTMWR